MQTIDLFIFVRKFLGEYSKPFDQNEATIILVKIYHGQENIPNQNREKAV